MKTLSFALLLMASLAFVLLGCSDDSNAVVNPGDQTIATSAHSASLAKGKAILHSATGASNEFYEGEDANVAPSDAKQYVDGSFDGVVQIFAHAQSHEYGFLHCKVMSLQIHDMPDGAKAAVIGMVEVEKGPFNGSYTPSFVQWLWRGKQGTSGHVGPPQPSAGTLRIRSKT